MKYLNRLMAILLFAAATTNAPAAELDSNVLELGQVRHSSGASGPVGSVSALLGEAGWFAGLGHGRARKTAEEELRVTAAWLGYAYGIAPLTDISVKAGYQRASQGTHVIDSYSAAVGVARAVFEERVIASLRGNHYFGGGLESADTTLAVGIEFFFTPSWSVLGEAELAQSSHSTLLALHYNY